MATRPTIRLGSSSWIQLAIDPRGAFTDTFSNAISLKNFDAVRFLSAGSVGDLTGDDNLIRLLLHEATHHASFASSIGHAMAALACSSSGLAGPGVSLLNIKSGMRLGLRDRLMLEWIDIIYGPLIEGLAIFAEYDLYSGPVNFTSHPLLHATALHLNSVVTSSAMQAIEEAKAAGRLRFESVDDLMLISQKRESLLNDHLRRNVRLTHDAVEQKETLLRQALLQPPEGERQYLLGYLAVKRAYLTLREVQPVALQSTDIFHMLMQNHWFADTAMANACLNIDDYDPIVFQRDTIGYLVERFQDQWDALYRKPSAHLTELHERLEKGVTEPSIGSMELLYLMRTSPANINIFSPKFLQHRLALRYASTPVEVSVDGSGLAVIKDRPSNNDLGTYPAVAQADIGTYPATIELVQSYDGNLQAVVVLGPTGLVATRCLRTGAWNLKSHVDAFDDLPSIEHVMAAMQKAESACSQVSDEEPDSQAMWRFQREQATAMRDGLYLQLAFPLQRSLREQSAGILGKHGFAGLLASDFEMRQLARYSLVFGGEGSTLEAAASMIGELPDAMLTRLREINELAAEKLGVELFEIQDNHITSAV